MNNALDEKYVYHYTSRENATAIMNANLLRAHVSTRTPVYGNTSVICFSTAPPNLADEILLEELFGPNIQNHDYFIRKIECYFQFRVCDLPDLKRIDNDCYGRDSIRFIRRDIDLTNIFPSFGDR